MTSKEIHNFELIFFYFNDYNIGLYISLGIVMSWFWNFEMLRSDMVCHVRFKKSLIGTKHAKIAPFSNCSGIKLAFWNFFNVHILVYFSWRCWKIRENGIWKGYPLTFIQFFIADQLFNLSRWNQSRKIKNEICIKNKITKHTLLFYQIEP